MGYGLHFGWAIEGAIGSMHKVDGYTYQFIALNSFEKLNCLQLAVFEVNLIITN